MRTAAKAQTAPPTPIAVPSQPKQASEATQGRKSRPRPKKTSPQLALDFDNAPKRKHPILGLHEFNNYLKQEKKTKSGAGLGITYWEHHREKAVEFGVKYLSSYMHPELAADIGVDIFIERVERMQEYLRKNAFLKSGYNFFGILNSAIVRAIIDKQRLCKSQANSLAKGLQVHKKTMRTLEDGFGDLDDGFAELDAEDDATSSIHSNDDDAGSIQDSGNEVDATNAIIRNYIVSNYGQDNTNLILAVLEKRNMETQKALSAKAGLSLPKARALLERVLAECRQWFNPEPMVINNDDGSRYVITPTWKDGIRYCTVEYQHNASAQGKVYLGKSGQPAGYKHGFPDEQQAREAIEQHQQL